MSYSIDDTWTAVSDLRGLFTSAQVADWMQILRPDVKRSTLRAEVSKHLRRLTTQGYLKVVTAGMVDGRFCYVYEVIYHG